MKVAIMGAGLSGLACAIELERHGIEPVVFEARSEVGDRFVNGEAFISLFSRPILDEVRYLAEHHGIFVKPSSNIGELVIHSANQQATLSGPIGFFSVRGRHPDSLEKQLAQQVRSNIRFNSNEPYESLLQKYTHVIVATGDAAHAQAIVPYEVSTTVTLRGVTVTGAFSRTQGVCWFDRTFAPNGGYGFLIPYSKREATVVLAIPEYGQLGDVDNLWDKFFDRVCNDLRQDLKVTDTFSVRHYLIGSASQARIGNTFLTGNCFDAVMPFLGFGQFSAILTGIYAAQDICGLGKYEQLTAPLVHSYRQSLALRRLIESVDDDALDKLVLLLNGPWGDKLVGSKRNVLKWAAYAARLWLGTRNAVVPNAPASPLGRSSSVPPLLERESRE